MIAVDRTLWSRHVKTVVAALSALFLLVSTGALATSFEEGRQYVPIKPQPPLTAGDEIEVMEFFWYGCPHCRDFEPTITKWAAGLPDGVDFTQVPVMFGGAADLHAQAYYALDAIGELERLHDKLFHVIHVDGRKLQSRAELDDFLQENGVDMDRFDEAMKSFAVAAKVNRARALMRRFGVRSVPTVVVDGRYRSGSGFTSYEEITEVIDHMIEKVLAQRKAQASR